ncbi:rhomboid family-domain-containing protein [Mucor mucedo]|uniref:rhomboid family-domain-containing protein n=1 Tax=Mucor mucedo TaxID=29922 RepID=UPI00221EC6E1|nr:rhomboid family-domain-containing protein [Mucor mucedo]KAI7888679.1 rhomboid family-domain-containing protein [Mucor mucedo]
MYPVHPTSTNHTTLSNTPSSINSPSRHGRKLSHVQFGKRPYNLQDEYTSSAFMMPFDENKQMVGGTDSTIEMLKSSCREFFELEPFNYMLGPSMEILIQSGARFPPCMRKVESMPPDQRYICLHTISQNPVVNMTDHRLFNLTCSLSTICGMSSFYQYRIPDQTYRFFTPLFIHTGLVHLCINMVVLIMLGVKVERTINSLRFTLLFIGSGMFGHALGANFAPPTSPFLGCSSSLLGLAGFLYTDLMMNWKTLEKPISNLFKLIVITGLCFFIGLIPG